MSVVKAKILLMVLGIMVLVALALILYEQQTAGFYLLYGAMGVGFFVLATNVLSLIQREGKQDD